MVGTCYLTISLATTYNKLQSRPLWIQNTQKTNCRVLTAWGIFSWTDRAESTVALPGKSYSQKKQQFINNDLPFS